MTTTQKSVPLERLSFGDHSIRPNPSEDPDYDRTGLIREFTFETFVSGPCNEFALNAAKQVVAAPGAFYNPLFICGGEGLGKTHLSNAIGNALYRHDQNMSVCQLHAHDFYQDVVRSFQQKSFATFQRFYRSLDLLIIDDIQFLGGKRRTQEEFFHLFNALTASRKQIVITSGTLPADLVDMDGPLISRFSGGLTVQVDSPDQQTCMAILRRKAESEKPPISDDVALLIASNLHSNIRELEGALKKVCAYSRFYGKDLNLDLAKEALKGMLGRHDFPPLVGQPQASVEN